VQLPGGVQRSHGTCVTNANSLHTGGRTVPSTNSSKVPQTAPKDKPANVSNMVFNDKYCIESNFIFPEWGCDDLLDFPIFLEQVSFVENLENSVFKGVKGSLVKHIYFWHGIGASDLVINTIKEGYTIPF
jgi:hypothetical protein